MWLIKWPTLRISVNKFLHLQYFKKFAAIYNIKFSNILEATGARNSQISQSLQHLEIKNPETNIKSMDHETSYLPSPSARSINFI